MNIFPNYFLYSSESGIEKQVGELLRSNNSYGFLKNIKQFEHSFSQDLFPYGRKEKNITEIDKYIAFYVSHVDEYGRPYPTVEILNLLGNLFEIKIRRYFIFLTSRISHQHFNKK
jgi:hypothetical protein